MHVKEIMVLQLMCCSQSRHESIDTVANDLVGIGTDTQLSVWFFYAFLGVRMPGIIWQPLT